MSNKLNSKIMRKFIISIVMLICAVSLNAQDYLIPTDSLVAYYPFNGNAQDMSGNGFDGMVTGPTLTTDRFGNPNSAYNFDGIDDIIVSYLDLYTRMSVSLWYKTSTPVTWYPFLFDYGDIMFTMNELGNHPFWQNDMGKMGFQTKGDGVPNSIFTGFIPNLGVWHHMVAVYDAQLNINKLYIDGAYAGSNSVTTPLNPTTGFTKIGCRSQEWVGDGSFFYYGDIDDIRIYKKALTAQEVFALFSENNTATGFQDNDSPFELKQNYPNPSTGSCVIKFTIPYDSRVEMDLITSNGTKIKSILNGNYQSGENFVSVNTENISPGIYYYRMKYDGKFYTKKMIVN